MTAYQVRAVLSMNALNIDLTISRLCSLRNSKQEALIVAKASECNKEQQKSDIVSSAFDGI